MLQMHCNPSLAFSLEWVRLLIVEIDVLCVLIAQALSLFVSVGLLHCIQEPVWVYRKGGDGAQ